MNRAFINFQSLSLDGTDTAEYQQQDGGGQDKVALVPQE
jgi:hypothetical protein